MPEAKQSFLHDSGAHTDERIMELRARHGWAGYGLYWAIIELMRANTELQINTSRVAALAYGLHAEEALLRGVLDVGLEVGLFEQEGVYLFSPSLKRRIAAFEAQKQARAERARTASARRWQSRTSDTASPEANISSGLDAQASAEQCISNATALLEQCSVNINTNLNLNKNQNKNQNKNTNTSTEAARTSKTRQTKLLDDEPDRLSIAPKIVMTAKEQATLIEEFGAESVNYHVKVCSDYLVSSGKVKKNSASFIRNWIRREVAERKGFYHPNSQQKPVNIMKSFEERRAERIAEMKARAIARDLEEAQ